jgi:hypothetical protein
MITSRKILLLGSRRPTLTLLTAVSYLSLRCISSTWQCTSLESSATCLLPSPVVMTQAMSPSRATSLNNRPLQVPFVGVLNRYSTYCFLVNSGSALKE